MSDFRRTLKDIIVPPKGTPNVVDLSGKPSERKGWAKTIKPTETE